MKETVLFTKVTKHAEDVDVQQGRVRLVEKHGNVEADAAADTRRRHQFKNLIDAKRKLPMARNHWCRIMLDLHIFMIAVARDSFNQVVKAVLPLIAWVGTKKKAQSSEACFEG